jgi:hypothetical protein
MTDTERYVSADEAEDFCRQLERYINAIRKDAVKLVSIGIAPLEKDVFAIQLIMHKVQDVNLYRLNGESFTETRERWRKSEDDR